MCTFLCLRLFVLCYNRLVFSTLYHCSLRIFYLFLHPFFYFSCCFLSSVCLCYHRYTFYCCLNFSSCDHIYYVESYLYEKDLIRYQWLDLDYTRGKLGQKYSTKIILESILPIFTSFKAYLFLSLMEDWDESSDDDSTLFRFWSLLFLFLLSI